MLCFLGRCTLFCTGTVNEILMVLLGTKLASFSHQSHLDLALQHLVFTVS